MSDRPVPAPRLEWEQMDDEFHLRADDEMWFISPRSNSGRFNLEAGDVLACGTIDYCKETAEQLNALLSPPVGTQP